MNMDIKQARRAIRKVAKKNGTTEQAVVSEIEKAIQAAVEGADGQTLARWEQIPCSGKIPNAYELIAYLGYSMGNT